MSYLKEMAEQGYNQEAISTFHYSMLPYLAKRLEVRPDDPIVDIGAAQGHCIIPLHKAGFNEISVVDIDPYNFERFEREYQFRCFERDASQEPLPFEDSSLQWIISFHLIEHLADPKHFLNETFRVLKPGGWLSLATPDWRKQYRTFYRDPTHIRPFDKRGMSRLLRMSGYEEVRAHSWGAARGLGRLQAFRWFPRLGMIGRDMLFLARK